MMQGKPGRAIGGATSGGTAGRETPCPPESAGPTTEPPNASPSRHPMSLGHDQQQSPRQDLKTRAGRDGEAVLRRVICLAPPARAVCVARAHLRFPRRSPDHAPPWCTDSWLFPPHSPHSRLWVDLKSPNLASKGDCPCSSNGSCGSYCSFAGVPCLPLFCSQSLQRPLSLGSSY